MSDQPSVTPRTDAKTKQIFEQRKSGNAKLAELSDFARELEQENATLRELAEGLAATVSIAVSIARTGWGERDAGISDALDQADRNLASYRAACPGEGQASNASNSPTDSRESQG